jgi:hypothetical protein
LNEQVELLELICKLATPDKISKIIGKIKFDSSLWLFLPSLNFDAKNYFDDNAKIIICDTVRDLIPKSDENKFFDFYGLYWFERPSDVWVSNFCLIRDTINKCEYDVIHVMNDKFAMLYKTQYTHETPTVSIHDIYVSYMGNFFEMKLIKPINYKTDHLKYIKYKTKYKNL